MDEKPYKAGSAFRKLVPFLILSAVVLLGTAHAASDLTSGQTARGDREALLVFCVMYYLPISLVAVAPAIVFVLGGNLDAKQLQRIALAAAVWPMMICGAWLVLFAPVSQADIGLCASGLAAILITAVEYCLRRRAPS